MIPPQHEVEGLKHIHGKWERTGDRSISNNKIDTTMNTIK